MFVCYCFYILYTQYFCLKQQISIQLRKLGNAMNANANEMCL